MPSWKKKGALVWCKDSNLWWSALLLGQNNNSEFWKVFIFGSHAASLVSEDYIQDFVEYFDEHVSQSLGRDNVFKEGIVEALVELYLNKKSFNVENVINLELNDIPIRPFRIPKWIERMLNDKKTKEVSNEGRHINTRLSKRTNEISNFNEKDFKEGSLVWGKYGKTYWSAVVLSKDMSVSAKQKSKVMWLNDFTTSMIKVDDLLDFADYFQVITNKFLKRMSESWKRGVITTLEELYNQKKKFKDEDLERLAADGLQNIPHRIDRIPQSVQNVLEKKNTDFNTYKKKCPKKSKVMIINLLLMDKTLVDVPLCLGCYTQIEMYQKHPVFEGDLCEKCYHKLKHTLNTIGDNGFHHFCVVCGNGGHTIMCESGHCGKAYCMHCVKDFCPVGTWESFIKQEKWICFLCNRENRFGVLSIRPDYILRIDKMFSEVRQIQFVNTPTVPMLKGGKLRVLSLFDGISTGLFALKKLNIPIEAYYASETDQSCINISAHNFSDKVLHIGDINKITEEDIKQLSPIHLVIGGSPCVDLTSVNQLRKGHFDVNGTGHLFFEFYRILCIVSKHNEDGFYWLYENVTCEEICYEDLINRYLQCDPILRDTIYVSPQHKERLFWGNLPQQLHNMSFSQSSIGFGLLPNQTNIIPNLSDISETKNCAHPITDDQNNTTGVFIAELEKILGITPNDVDVWKMPTIQRQRVLEAAWSVPVIIHLFTPLQQICPV
ncbi:hypothetical protein RI129_012081 [Pyrocoelia pectoralis]|uniref:PHD-type domain-containing protein n=1 Tax=Pyrocoelia pectoralis TaxID=417401 RepID=A0AAN7VA12_9COLE